MYARVAVATNALNDNGLPIHVAMVLHRTLLEDINAHGRLVFTDDPEATAFVRALKEANIPVDARTLWRETLTTLAKNQRIDLPTANTVPLGSVQAITTLRSAWGPSTDVAIVAPESCAQLGVPAETGILSEPNQTPDVVTTATATYSPAFARLKELAHDPSAGTGSLREDFWSQVLRPLATGASTVTVMDGYLYKTACAISRRERWTRNLRTEHTTWLLEHLDAVMAPGATAHLIGSQADQYTEFDATETARVIRDQWGPFQAGRLSKVTLSLATPHNNRGERFPHDRHIRFSNGGAIKIEAGFDRLREDTIWDPDGMEWKYLWEPRAIAKIREREERARSYVRHDEVTLLQR